MKKITLTLFLIIIFSIAFAIEKQNRYEFELDSLNGKVKFSDFKDKVVVVYFGYTYCPDICPTSLTIISNALNLLSSQELNSTQSIFISLDPKRDDLKHLNDYVKYFHPNLIGLRGEEKVIKELADRYGTKYEIVDLNNSSSIGYSIAHTSFIYIFYKKAKFNSALQPSTPNELADKIKKAIYLR
jgi:protein SCO1